MSCMHWLAGALQQLGPRRAGIQRWSNDLDESFSRWRRALVLVLVFVLVSRILEHVVNRVRYGPMAVWQTPSGEIKTNGQFLSRGNNNNNNHAEGVSATPMQVCRCDGANKIGTKRIQMSDSPRRLPWRYSSGAVTIRAGWPAPHVKGP